MHVRSKTYMPKSESRWNKKWTTFLGAEPVITRIKSDNKIISSDWLKTPSKGSLAVDKVSFIGRQGYGVPLHDLHVLNSTTLNWPRVVQNKPLILKIGQNWLDYGLIIGWGENKVFPWQDSTNHPYSVWTSDILTFSGNKSQILQPIRIRVYKKVRILEDENLKWLYRLCNRWKSFAKCQFYTRKKSRKTFVIGLKAPIILKSGKIFEKFWKFQNYYQNINFRWEFMVFQWQLGSF